MHQSGHSRAHSMHTVQFSSRSPITPRLRGGQVSAHEAGHPSWIAGAGMRRRPRAPSLLTWLLRARPVLLPPRGQDKILPQRNTVEAIGQQQGIQSRVAVEHDAEHLVCFPLVPGRTAVDAGGRGQARLTGQQGPQQQVVPPGQRVHVGQHGHPGVQFVHPGQPVEEVTVQLVPGAGQRGHPGLGGHRHGDHVRADLAVQRRSLPAATSRLQPADDRLRGHGVPRSAFAGARRCCRASTSRPCSSASGRGGQPGT